MMTSIRSVLSVLTEQVSHKRKFSPNLLTPPVQTGSWSTKCFWSFVTEQRRSAQLSSWSSRETLRVETWWGCYSEQFSFYFSVTWFIINKNTTCGLDWFGLHIERGHTKWKSWSHFQFLHFFLDILKQSLFRMCLKGRYHTVQLWSSKLHRALPSAPFIGLHKTEANNNNNTSWFTRQECEGLVLMNLSSVPAHTHLSPAGLAEPVG